MVKIHEDLKNKEYWYKDITLIPNRLPDFERDIVDLTTSFTKKTTLKVPLVSSPMDTVTESKMAILMALYGGIGIIHYNFASINEQIKEVECVKRFEAGFVYKPIVRSPEHTIRDIWEIKEKHNFFSTPITQDGTLNSKLVGIVTHRDVRYKEDMGTKLKEIMTPREKVTVGLKENTVDKNDLGHANNLIRKYNLDTLPIVDRDDKVVAIVTHSDLEKNKQYPLATKDENKQLKVFVAIESRLELIKERVSKASDAGASGVVVDAGIVFREQLKIAKWIKENFPKLEVVLGNIDSAKMTRTIVEEASQYCDALRVGVGPGAACITQQELGTGRAQASAVFDCAQEAKRLESKYGLMPIIADGGIKVLDSNLQDVFKPGDITKALALGAQTCMMGSLLAGLDESPGEAEFDTEQTRMVKKYRGMGSLEAMNQRSSVRYAVDKVKIRIAEGKVTKTPYRGSAHNFLPKLIVGIKQSFQKQGFKNLQELKDFADVRLIAK